MRKYSRSSRNVRRRKRRTRRNIRRSSATKKKSRRNSRKTIMKKSRRTYRRRNLKGGMDGPRESLAEPQADAAELAEAGLGPAAVSRLRRALAAKADAAPLWEVTDKVSEHGHNVRAEPSTDAAVVGLVFTGERLLAQPSARRGDWLPVRWGDEEAWVLTEAGGQRFLQPTHAQSASAATADLMPYPPGVSAERGVQLRLAPADAEQRTALVKDDKDDEVATALREVRALEAKFVRADHEIGVWRRREAEALAAEATHAQAAAKVLAETPWTRELARKRWADPEERLKRVHQARARARHGARKAPS